MTSQRRLDQYFNQSKRKREDIPTKRRKLNEDCTDRDFTEESCMQRKQKKAIVSLQFDKSVVHGTLEHAAKHSPQCLNAPVPTVQIPPIADSTNVNPPKRQRIVAESLEITEKNNDTKNPKNCQSQLEAKRTVDADAMKEKLAKCGKLAELQERLAKLRKCTASVQSLKKVQESELQHKSIPAEMDKVPGEKITTDTNKNIPAYQRFHHLASADAATSLVLPYKYKLLDDVFHSVDTVVSMLHNRQELCTFSKLKPAVQQMLRKTLEMRHLGQLKTVFPLAYIFGKTALKNNLQEITVAPNFNTDGGTMDKTTVADNNGNFNEKPKLVSHSQQDTQRMSPSLLLVRRNIFHSRLLELAKQHHDSFLISLDPPINLAKDSVTRWHPRFRVDEVPDLEEAELPVLDNSNKCVSANEVLQKVKGLYGPKIENALRVTAAKLEENNLNAVDVAPPAKINANLKGIPLSLLQKIRAKEAEKIKREMTRDAKVDRKLAMISRLAEIARILRVYFISEKKAAIIIDDVTKKLEDSFQTALPQGEVKEHVVLLAEIAPAYLSMVTIRHVEYVKINKQIDLNAVAERINQAKKSLI